MRIKSLIDLHKRLFQYPISRRFGFLKPLPVNLTLNVTYQCNSRCSTCNLWKKQAKELSLDEWKRVFQNYHGEVFWLIFSGGEPFLRKELVKIVLNGYRYLRPAVINIPTNGILYKLIPKKTEEILKECSQANVVINFSLDGVGKEHDKIRGVPGNFEKLMSSYRLVKKLKRKYPNLTVGLHTVISQYNVEKIGRICEFALSLDPDQYITEIAEERVELGTVGQKITPSLGRYSQAVDIVSQKIKERRFNGLAKITEALRLEYYQLVKRILKEKTQVIPCYAGWASAQISADGEVWPCCVRADNLGNLREHDYNFSRIWFGKKAEKMRRQIKNKECFCPLASASYTNMLMDLQTVLKVGYHLVS